MGVRGRAHHTSLDRRNGDVEASRAAILASDSRNTSPRFGAARKHSHAKLRILTTPAGPIVDLNPPKAHLPGNGASCPPHGEGGCPFEPGRVRGTHSSAGGVGVPDLHRSCRDQRGSARCALVRVYRSGPSRGGPHSHPRVQWIEREVLSRPRDEVDGQSEFSAEVEHLRRQQPGSKVSQVTSCCPEVCMREGGNHIGGVSPEDDHIAEPLWVEVARQDAPRDHVEQPFTSGQHGHAASADQLELTTDAKPSGRGRVFLRHG
jgi:hypothetical protein